MKIKEHKTIGIIGGMGPQSSAYMYKLLIDLSTQYYQAHDSMDFPEIILHSVPTMDFISNTDNIPLSTKILKKSVKNFNKLNVSCICIACNTAHVLLNELQRVSKAPFVSMIDQVAAAVKKDNLKKVGILGTPVTLQTKLYQNALQSVGIDSVIPDADDYAIVNQVIRNVIDGTYNWKDSDRLVALADTLTQQGAEGIILGCTELPLAFPPHYRLPIYNSVKVLCLAVLEEYYAADVR